MDAETVIAAIDAGGTSFKCALVRADGNILQTWRVPTQTPETTLSACAASFERACEALQVQPRALGIASFGPVDIDPQSATYGTITGTAKPGWSTAAIGPALSKALGLPFHLDSDVNAALAAEMRWGAAQNHKSAAYMTVGTGIGVGLYLNGDIAARPVHPEFGHIRVARHADDLAFRGTCMAIVSKVWPPPEHLKHDGAMPRVCPKTISAGKSKPSISHKPASICISRPDSKRS